MTELRPAGPAGARAGTSTAERPHPTSSFTALTRTIQEAGYMRRRYGFYAARLSGAVVAVAGLVAGVVLIGDSWWQVALAAVAAVVFTQIAFLGHDAAHKQIFRSGRANDWASLVLADLFVGLSYGWWQRKHTRHHAKPNQVDADPDIDLPVLSFTPGDVEKRRSPLARWFLARQGWFFFPLLLLEGLDLHVSSVKRLAQPGPMQRRWVEALFLTVRLGGWLALVLAVMSPGKAAVFLAVQLGLFGLYMGASFAPNHKGMPLVPKDARIDFLRRQVLTSRNIRGGRWLDVVMGGLNHQVEHHLFPSMPSISLRRVAPIVREYCATHQIPYTQVSLARSYAIVVRHLNTVGLGDRDPFVCPMVAAYRV
ncbi:acyl-CoA desaturase [Cellulomonas sp. H30R-01]|uniref:fatty acid desaturase family protein n=1 Tax=Cellulomonas sp. H30R-01 TaxID=2704467 RepID=UPI001EE3B055|nr:acyl-CoA desaturase [Cellulomonas sp. H30R-01]